MKEPAIPTAKQIRRMPVTSVKALRDALTEAGLHVRPGGAHLRVETPDGVLIGGIPNTPSDARALRNCRSWLARRVGEMRTQHAVGQ